MAEQAGYLQFIESFNHIHKYLQRYTEADDNISFSDLLFRSKKHPVLNLYLDELHVYRKLRNIIIHQTDDFEQIIALPSDKTVKRIQFIQEQLVDPQKLDVFKGDVIRFDAKESLKEALNISAEKEFLKFPLYEDNQFVGLVTSHSLGKWLQKKAQQDQLVLDDKMEELLVYERKGRYHFISIEASIYEAWYLYRSTDTKIEAFLVTATGKESEEIEAIITGEDLIQYLYTNDLYVFH